MAALAAPLLEGVAARVLVGLGVGAAGGLAAESARKRQKEAEKATAMPIARVNVCNDEDPKCKECPPDKGFAVLRKPGGWSEEAIRYQIRIAQMPPAPAGNLTEWSYLSVDFDGFDSSQCLLKEAKAGYDTFFDEDGDPVPWFKGVNGIQKQAVSQATVADTAPQIKLRWYFMQPLLYRYCTKLFSSLRLKIETEHHP